MNYFNFLNLVYMNIVIIIIIYIYFLFIKKICIYLHTYIFSIFYLFINNNIILMNFAT